MSEQLLVGLPRKWMNTNGYPDFLSSDISKSDFSLAEQDTSKTDSFDVTDENVSYMNLPGE